MPDQQTDTKPQDLGPHPKCPRCKGTGECSNAQFRCPCRWSTSPYRADAERQEQMPDQKTDWLPDKAPYRLGDTVLG